MVVVVVACIGWVNVLGEAERLLIMELWGRFRLSAVRRNG
jgi:hypothetical protein